MIDDSFLLQAVPQFLSSFQIVSQAPSLQGAVPTSCFRFLIDNRAASTLLFSLSVDYSFVGGAGTDSYTISF